MDNVNINPFDPTSDKNYVVYIESEWIDSIFNKFAQLSEFVANCEVERKALIASDADVHLYLTKINFLKKYIISYNQSFSPDTTSHTQVSVMDILNYEFDCESYPTKQVNESEKNTEEHSVDISLESGALAEEVILCLLYSGYTIKYDSVKNIIKVVKGN